MAVGVDAERCVAAAVPKCDRAAIGRRRRSVQGVVAAVVVVDRRIVAVPWTRIADMQKGAGGAKVEAVTAVVDS